MAHRVISLLQRASPCSPPAFAKGSRARGAKAAGLRYERAVAKALPGAKHGQWFEFWDSHGPGYCQPDFLIIRPKHVFVLEVKLTDTEAGRRQILDLYTPVLELVFGRPARGIVVTKFLTSDSRRDEIVDNLEAAMFRSAQLIPTLHWLGKGPI